MNKHAGWADECQGPRLGGQHAQRSTFGAVTKVVAVIAAGILVLGCAEKEPTAADMGTNRAKVTCKKFDALLAKNRAGTSSVEDVAALVVVLREAEGLAVEPVGSAARAVADELSNGPGGPVTERFGELKAACREIGVKVR